MNELPLNELESRVADLEVRLVFQDDTIQALNDVVSAQQMELEKLRRALEVLARRQADLAASMPGEAVDEAPPPHY
ncbi:SlyX family protein [Halopseudomonas pelagia]|uniref:SlyX family protein n=1 Tax=Halopseudomonas pelagia TaxID=553151 RepID=UPI0003A8516C|nr:SlyX family protein [Halopseudomonas pelagia]|tara:strand:- start:63316 stop:63543 length:228 start_codon:yes stop_codon:yes gene_type:complete